MPSKPKKPSKPQFRPGENVRVKVDGKVIGPIYFAQVQHGKAELQGRERYVVEIEDLLPLKDD